MKQEQIIAAVEKIAPLWAAASWDLSGLQIASSREKISRMAVFLDPRPAIISQALEMGSEFMVSHHPLTLKPVLPARLDAWRENLRLLLRANVALYAAHTSLDANLAGPAGWFGRKLNLRGLEVLEPIPCQNVQYPQGLGFGQIGDLPKPLPLAEFRKEIMRLLNIDFATICGPEAEGQIRRVACCPGSGGSMIELAQSRGAQLFITGDVKYHSALNADIPVMDVGHHSLEEEMARLFAKQLEKELPGLDIVFIPSKSPFRKVEADISGASA